jgi:hypothetical protein
VNAKNSRQPQSATKSDRVTEGKVKKRTVYASATP